MRSPSTDPPSIYNANTATTIVSTSTDASSTQYLSVPVPGFNAAPPISFDASQPSGSWFEKPIPQKLVSELFNDYVLYHHPYFPLFSIQHFLSDFQSGHTQFCSSILIYAVMSIACNYWKGKVHGEGDMAIRAEESGEAFANIVQRKLFNVKEASLTSVQALTILGMRQGSTGDLHGAYHWHGAALRMALAMDMHLDEDPDNTETDSVELEVRKLTFWGIYNVEMALGIFVGKVPQISNISISVPKPSYSEKRDSFVLSPPKARRYSEVEVNREIHYIRFVSHFCELSKLVNELNLSYYAPQKQIVVSDIYYALQRYHSWEHELPVEFQSTDLGGAEVSYLHMYYRQLIIQLLRPFLAYDTNKLGLSPKTICMGRATEIVHLWRGLKAQYSFWEIHMLVICPIRDAAHIFLFHVDEPSAASYISELVEDLRQFSRLHSMAGNVISSLHEIATRYRIDFPKGLFDRYLQDQRGVFPPALPLTPFIMRAKVDIEPGSQANYSTHVHSHYTQPTQVQEMGHYGNMNALTPQQAAAYMASMQNRDYPQYMGGQQMSAASEPMTYQMMQPYSAQGPASQQPPR
ncbi:Fungal specific transcription factor domain-containing protein 19 [Elsinoe fawcettii]|nr:Fungal specific transcription factor domain-containing protein 19 [Elsinoe fawcettii]